MAGFRDFLTRFRPAASPGRAAPGGVPADRSAELRAELAPPLALLEQVEAEARSIRERAADTAVSRRQEAERQEEAIVAEAREEARRVRARAAERVLRAAEGEAAELRAAAEREATAVRERARTRMSPLADRVLAQVWEDLAAEERPSPAPAPHRSPGCGRPREGDP
ncbi:hypothetical protein [Streptomyces akebiae]|uniref:Uncharacterized protein n=1 Tax=Streptomyces akebiae TaxID=2865673 RepID=A0ABX8Y4E6_9ACTN|nr:hypothetical protein [Streptomyces akebiae]QYX82352.1 hypothetical protein K1J60_42590 [Streptomyces akebiae]